MLVQEPTQGAIWHCLQNYAYEDAIFLAERLVAEVGTDDAVHLLATAYYRAGNVGRAYTLMRNNGYKTPQLKLLMARCCYDLGKLDEAESVLVGNGFSKQKTQDFQNEYGNISCFVFQLLGIIYSKTDRVTRSFETLKRSLKINPFLWHSYQVLCDVGLKPDPTVIFQLDNVENFSNINGNSLGTMLTQTENANVVSDSIINVNNSSVKHPPTEIIPLQSENISTPLPNSVAALNTPITTITSITDGVENSEIVTKEKKYVHFKAISPIPPPQFGVLQGVSQRDTVDSDTSLLTAFTLNSPSPLSQSNNMQNLSLQKRILCRSSKDSLVSNKSTIYTPGNNSNFQSPPGYVRRSSRLGSSVKENNKNRMVAPKSPVRKTKTRSSKNQNSLSEMNEKNKKEVDDSIVSEKSVAEKNLINQSLSQQALAMQKQSANGLMCLLKNIGSAYLQLSQYSCKKAIELFNQLPSQHFHTSWVLSHLAKAYFQINEYSNSIKYFSDVRDKEPYSLRLMEYYSIALWHQQNEVQLSALAQDLIEINSESPEAWCATGNCFSLQKEHEAAIKFFSRAIQVDPNFAYAYCLLGHEHLATEELDRAMSCYRSAVRIDPRHYNAWYGIGLVLFKQERYVDAAFHFRKAANIHPESAILLCHIAVAEHALQNSQTALDILDQALGINSNNPLCKYHRASILVSLERYEEALAELNDLKQLIPKESNVYFLMGKVYKKLNDYHRALLNFSWAMDLDPKGASGQFKETLDPAVNCVSLEEDDNANNPRENGRSDLSTSAGLESSQESLASVTISGIEDLQSTAVSTPAPEEALRRNEGSPGSSRDDYTGSSFLNRVTTRPRFN